MSRSTSLRSLAGAPCGGSPGQRPRRRRPARTRRTRPSTSSCSLPPSPDPAAVYFTDRGIEELDQRRGDETVSSGWVASPLVTFVGLKPESETEVERLATWLARL